MQEIFYIVTTDFWDYRKYTPVKLTGRWKIIIPENGGRPILFLEHQGRFFKKWVNEIDFWVGNKREEYINTCDSKFHEFGQTHMFCRIKK